MRSEKEHLRNELNHATEELTACGTLIGELNGRRADQTQIITDLTAACERLKEELSELALEKYQLAKRCQKARGRALKLSEKLQLARSNPAASVFPSASPVVTRHNRSVSRSRFTSRILTRIQ